MNNIPYVYLIGWKALDVWYIGVRFKVNCDPGDLWNTYFTSSKHVKAFRQEHGEPDHIEILKEFNNSVDALEYEEKKLKELDVLKKSNWLNRNIGGHLFNSRLKETREKISRSLKGKRSWLGKKHSEESKAKISKSLIGRKDIEEIRKKKSLARMGDKNPNWGKFGEQSPNFGKRASEETRKKMSMALKGKKRSDESRKNLSEGAKNRKPISEETRKKMSESQKGRKHSKETIEKMRLRNLGENNPMFKRKNKQKIIAH